ncbi:histidine kinase [Taibaiella sp. KBW10]|uniref:sensor histidine kinase n=1 Tax=Taibaiella sp. KBW10 TaxID=2153357 RepID=UPI001F1C519E|nr:histidine kinase [Taibaiella sp. KBW10]
MWLIAYKAQAQYHYISPEYDITQIKFNTKGEDVFFWDAIEDNEGYIWLSGSKGLHVYDGYNVINYSKTNAAYPLKKDSSLEVFGNIRKGAAGLLYVQEGSYHSFICFDPYSRKVKYRYETRHKNNKGFHFRMSISDRNEIMAVAFDREKGTYFVRRVTNDKNAKQVYSGLYNKDDIWHFEFSCGYHWLVNDNQILRIAADGSQVKSYQAPDNRGVFRVYSDKEHFFFLDQKCKNIYTWDARQDKMVHYMTLPALFNINYSSSAFSWQWASAFAVKNDMVYIGNDIYFYLIDKKDHSIQDFSGMYSELRKGQKGLPFNNLLKKIIFAGNNTYLVKDKGMYSLTERPKSENPFFVGIDAEVYKKYPLLSFRGLAEDDQKNIYASFYNGLLIKPKNANDFRVFPISKQLSSKVQSTYDLNCWKGSLLWSNLILDLKTGQYDFLGDKNDHNLIMHTVQCLNKDTMWFYPWESGKLFRYDLARKKLIMHPMDKNLGSFGEALEEISDIIPDASGNNFWLATKLNGLALMTKDGKLLKKYDQKYFKMERDIGATINMLYLSKEGLWFGCAGGLGLLNTQTGTYKIYKNQYNKDGNLVDRNIYSLLVDTTGNFYLGTSFGICYFDVVKKKFYNLHEDHPLAALEFNRASALKTSDNRYYFGGTNGLYSFLPSELPFNQEAVMLIRPLKVSNIIVFNSQKKKYYYLGAWNNLSKELVLGPFDNTITIDFSVPEFGRSVYYSYRIKEQNGQWTDYSLNGSLYLYNLRSGSYTLEIKASTDLNDDNARYFQINIVIRQVWHRMIWVRILFLLATITIVSLFMRLRYRQKLKRQQYLANLRTKISMDLHDDVGSILSGLAVQSEMLGYTSAPENKGALDYISSQSRDAMEKMRDIVWSMDNRKDKYENMIDRMRSFADKTLPARGIRYEFSIERVIGEAFINPEKRQAIYLIFKEALTNIVKHSDATRVVIKLIKRKDILYLSIQDNGKKETGIPTDGMGLDNMRLRADKIGGVLTAIYDEGFRIELKV